MADSWDSSTDDSYHDLEGAHWDALKAHEKVDSMAHPEVVHWDHC
jgi:hypothetical protein